MDTGAITEGDEGEQARLLPDSVSGPRLDRYAKAEYLSNYIPELDPTNDRAITLRVKMAKRATMLKLQMGIATLIVCINIGIAIWAFVRFPPDHRGMGTFSYSNCSSATTINSGLHVLLNIVSSLFLGAGNYCMQILVAPSREEIAGAHRKGTALDIGVPSVKNLRHIEWIRAAAWGSIGFIATLLHIFWNSSIFTSLPVAVIPRVVATSDFFTAGDNWTASDPLSHLSWWKHAPGFGQASANISMLYALQDEAVNFTYLDTTACIERYIDPLASTGSLIIVARNISSVQNNGSSLIDAWASGWEAWESSSSWICRGYEKPGKYCDWDYARTFASNWTLAWPKLIHVDHCLTGPQGDNMDRCGIHYSAYIIGIVLGCTFLESLLIYWTVFYHFRNAGLKEENRKKRTMVTMGDAIDNFLEDPHSHIDETNDTSTLNSRKPGTVEVKMATWVVEAKVSWFSALSFIGWMGSLTLFGAGIGVTGWFIGSSANHLVSMGIDLSPAALWKQGFKVNPATIVRSLGPLTSIGSSGTVALLCHILIANSPQVMVSFLYIFYNNILTRQVVGDEWVRFLHEDGKKVLRVTSPEGMQRSSYFLSLPLKYSISLMILSILLHWLISQSIFLVQSSAFGPGTDGARLPVYDYSARGYSILGGVLAISLGFALVVALLLMSYFRHYENIPARFQLMAFNSSAIEAMCQRPEGDSDARFFPIRIGVVTSQDADPSGCLPKVVFSTDIKLQVPEPRKQYLQPVFVQDKSKWERSITNSQKYIIGLVSKYVWRRKR